MKGEPENIDHLFAEELKGFSPTPPEGAWKSIEQRMAAQQTRKIPLYYYRIAAGLAALISIGSLAFLFFAKAPELPAEMVVDANNDTPSTAIKNTTQALNKKEASFQENIEQNRSELSLSGESETIGSTASFNANNTLPVKETTSILYAKEDKSSGMKKVERERIEIILSSNQEEKELIIHEDSEKYSESYLAFLSEFEDFEDKKQSYSKWAVGGQAGPQYSYRNVTTGTASQEFVDLYNQSENGIVAYAGGVSFAFKPAKRLSIQSGVYYSKIGQTTTAQFVQPYYNEFAGIDGFPNQGSNISTPPEIRVSTSMGSVDGKEPLLAGSEEQNRLREAEFIEQYADVKNVNQYLEFLEVPLIARYAIIDRKFDFHLLGGFSTNFLVASPGLPR
jgi:hypothetical protein